MSRRRYGCGRTVFIFVEGESEMVYLQRLKRRGTNYRVEIAKMNERDAVAFVNRSYTAAYQSGLEGSDEVYAVFDDDIHSKEKLEKAASVAASKGVNIVLSNPCFEVWLLYHFCETFDLPSSAECEGTMSDHLKYRYKKSDGIGPVDNDVLAEAVRRCRKRSEGLDVLGIKQTPCTSSVYALVQRLMRDD